MGGFHGTGSTTRHHQITKPTQMPGKQSHAGVFLGTTLHVVPAHDSHNPAPAGRHLHEKFFHGIGNRMIVQALGQRIDQTAWAGPALLAPLLHDYRIKTVLVTVRVLKVEFVVEFTSRVETGAKRLESKTGQGRKDASTALFHIVLEALAHETTKEVSVFHLGSP